MSTDSLDFVGASSEYQSSYGQSSFSEVSVTNESYAKGFSLRELFSQSSDSPVHKKAVSTQLAVLDPSFLCSHKRVTSNLLRGGPKVGLYSECTNKSVNSTKHLPIFGVAPCTAHCPRCQEYVHTVIDFRNNLKIPKGVLSVFSSVFHCCSGPSWFNKMRIHTCSKCGQPLAKITV